MANVIVTPRNLIDVMKGEITNILVVGLRDRLEANIVASIPESIKDDPPINVDVTYNVSPDGDIQLSIQAASETVTGVKEVQVSESSAASAHTRVLDGQRNFKTESGFVTSNKVPESVLKQIVDHGVQATRDPNAHVGHSFDADL